DAVVDQDAAGVGQRAGQVERVAAVEALEFQDVDARGHQGQGGRGAARGRVVDLDGATADGRPVDVEHVADAVGQVLDGQPVRPAGVGRGEPDGPGAAQVAEGQRRQRRAARQGAVDGAAVRGGARGVGQVAARRVERRVVRQDVVAGLARVDELL